MADTITAKDLEEDQELDLKNYNHAAIILEYFEQDEASRDLGRKFLRCSHGQESES